MNYTLLTKRHAGTQGTFCPVQRARHNAFNSGVIQLTFNIKPQLLAGKRQFFPIFLRSTLCLANNVRKTVPTHFVAIANMSKRSLTKLFVAK
jgi:hypothetical protein